MACGYTFEPWLWILLLLVATMAQSSVNTLNDWADYRAGTDTKENSDDPTDAVLVYENPNPSHVLALGFFYMLVALACGIICIVAAHSLFPVILGAIGGIVIVIYSSGKIPISYLPLGEIVSGVVMGCLIPLADVCVFAGYTYAGSFGIMGPIAQIDWGRLLICTVPFVIGIGMIMATQNTCDIERDKPIGRHTLPVMLGREKARTLYRIFAVIWILVMLHCSFWYFGEGFWACIVCLVLGTGTIRSVLVSPLVHEVRGPSMGAINKSNLFIEGAYVLGMMVSLL